MNPVSRFLRMTILGDAFFLIPIVLLVYLLNKAFDLARRGLKPVAKNHSRPIGLKKMGDHGGGSDCAPLFPRRTVRANHRGAEDHV
jgi:hypothetical protein